MVAGVGIVRWNSMTSSIQRAARFALPYWASILVVNPDADVLAVLDRENRPRWQFPQTSGDPVAELENLRAEGWDYLLVPSAAFGWLDHQKGLKHHLGHEYRLVCREDACLIYALENSSAALPEKAPDGLPLPPREMIGLVGGTIDPGYFFESGAAAATWIAGMLEDNDRSVERLDDVLDFGCGCGRVIRHWRTRTPARLHGTDYNPYLVEWCRAHLGFAEFEQSMLEPPLAYPDEAFDLVYALSVFTHLHESLQMSWMTELTRILKPGGLLVLTVHGTNYLPWLDAEESSRFESGQLVVREWGMSGSDFCAAFHPERYLRDTLARNLEILEYSLAPKRDASQDAVLLLKR
jgi:SAM-dependent methyltransferase